MPRAVNHERLLARIRVNRWRYHGRTFSRFAVCVGFQGIAPHKHGNKKSPALTGLQSNKISNHKLLRYVIGSMGLKGW
jgi:hypothetical protein